jgi:hypothetical protein
LHRKPVPLESSCPMQKVVGSSPIIRSSREAPFNRDPRRRKTHWRASRGRGVSLQGRRTGGSPPNSGARPCLFTIECVWVVRPAGGAGRFRPPRTWLHPNIANDPSDRLNLDALTRWELDRLQPAFR